MQEPGTADMVTKTISTTEWLDAPKTQFGSGPLLSEAVEIRSVFAELFRLLFRFLFRFVFQRPWEARGTFLSLTTKLELSWAPTSSARAVTRCRRK